MYTKAASIVTDTVESMPDDANADASTILKSCEQISEVSDKAIIHSWSKKCQFHCLVNFYKLKLLCKTTIV